MRVGFDVHSAVLADSGHIRRSIRKRVLISDIAGDLGGDGIHIGDRMGKVGDSACLIGERFQCMLRVARLASLGIVEKADGIDDRAVQILDVLNRLLQREG